MQTCGMDDCAAMSCELAWLMQEVNLPEVPPLTPEDQILLVRQSPLPMIA